jgi:hypothetical protein
MMSIMAPVIKMASPSGGGLLDEDRGTRTRSTQASKIARLMANGATMPLLRKPARSSSCNARAACSTAVACHADSGRSDLAVDYRSIARLAGVCRDTAIGAVRKLADIGLIQKIRRRVNVRWGRGRECLASPMFSGRCEQSLPGRRQIEGKKDSYPLSRTRMDKNQPLKGR